MMDCLRTVKVKEIINQSPIDSYDDMHGGNVGYLEDGRMVAIDFSHCKARRAASAT